MRLFFTNRDTTGIPDDSIELRLYNATGSPGSWGWGSIVGDFTNAHNGNYYIDITSSGNYGMKKSTDGGITYVAMSKTLGMFLPTEDIKTHMNDTTIHFPEASVDHNNIRNKGTNTHGAIDTHIANNDKHREINDSGSSTVNLWSAYKILAELAKKSDVATVNSHITDDELHRVINDSGEASTELWSADKIKTELLEKANKGDAPHIDGYGGGKLQLQYASALAILSSGDTEKIISVNVPQNVRITDAQLRVEESLSQTFSAIYDGGLSQSIGETIPKEQNTKLKKPYDIHADSNVTTGITNVKITPTLGSFDGGGKVRATVYYWELTDMDSVPSS